MKYLLSLIIFSFFGNVLAANKIPTPQPVTGKQPATTSSTATSNSTQTNHSFEDLLVQGKYHFSDEAVTTVEEDKVLDSLIGVRLDFKDKIEKSASKY